MTITTDIGLELASMEFDCECAGVLHEEGHITENGISHRVPRFPGVRVPCAECDGTGRVGGSARYEDGTRVVLADNTIPWFNEAYSCDELEGGCQGRGWVVSDDPIAWMKCLPSGWGLHRTDSSLVPWQVRNNVNEVQILAGEALEALQQALLKAVA